MTIVSNPYRLDRRVVPSAYQISLAPNLVDFTFEGHVDIAVRVEEPTTTIVVNARDLQLTTALLQSGDVTYVSAPAVLDAQYETASFTFAEELPLGDATLSIDFVGELNDKLTGFYRSSYTDPEGVTHAIATTQFENCSARRAFPCWDEPAFKATYETTLTIDPTLSAFSNTREVGRTTRDDGRVSVHFAPTMKMSTYLVAFIVGPFETTETVDVDGVPLRIVYPQGQGHLTELAMDASAFGLRWFANYFGIPYPGDKVDMVAIPDFNAGAMENLGCITYRMTDLLIDPATASLAEKERVAGVIHHELAHMWFGDLVTMEWWQGIWLNEAFATFMQVLCTNAYKPEWNVFTEFGTDRDRALCVDGLHSTRPIEYEVISPDDTRGMFDVLTYEKGGSVLRMIEQWLGTETFRRGIHNYLIKHSYGNTVTADLWAALEEASGEPVGQIMDTFILQGGHPAVTLENGVISQAPFMYGPRKGTSAIADEWLVPFFTRNLDGGEPIRHLLGAEPIAVDGPVLLNAGGAGVFRSFYGDAEIAVVSAHLNELTPLERFTVVTDVWNAVLAGYRTWDNFHTLIRSVGDQDEPQVWGVIYEALDYVNRALTPEQRPALAALTRDLVSPHFNRLGWEPAPGESERVGQTRSTVLGLLGRIGGGEGVNAEARRRFEANEVSGNLATVILRLVATENRPEDYATFIDRYRNGSTPQEKQRYMHMLNAFGDETLALDAAEKCFSEFRSQDANSMLGLLCSNMYSGPAVWRYMVERWTDADEKFPRDSRAYSTRGVRMFISDRAFSAEVEAFHRAHPIAGQQKTVDQSLEVMNFGLNFAESIRRSF